MRPIDADDFIMSMTSLYKIAGWDEHEVHFSLADLKSNLDYMKTLNVISVDKLLISLREYSRVAYEHPALVYNWKMYSGIIETVCMLAAEEKYGTIHN